MLAQGNALGAYWIETFKSPNGTALISVTLVFQMRYLGCHFEMDHDIVDDAVRAPLWGLIGYLTGSQGGCQFFIVSGGTRIRREFFSADLI